MSIIKIDLEWKLEEGGLLSPGKYSNKHKIKYNSDIDILGDSARIGMEIKNM